MASSIWSVAPVKHQYLVFLIGVWILYGNRQPLVIGGNELGADLLYFTQRKAGDVNEDGIVDVNDYDIWRMHVYDDLSALTLLEGRSLGDLNGDRQINLDDFAIIKANQTPGAAPVPEPAALILLGCGAAVLSLRTRRRRQTDDCAS